MTHGPLQKDHSSSANDKLPYNVIHTSPCECYTLSPSHYFRYHYPDYIWWENTSSEAPRCAIFFILFTLTLSTSVRILLSSHCSQTLSSNVLHLQRGKHFNSNRQHVHLQFSDIPHYVMRGGTTYEPVHVCLLRFSCEVGNPHERHCCTTIRNLRKCWNTLKNNFILHQYNSDLKTWLDHSLIQWPRMALVLKWPT
jgi:hypothetical protein